MGRAIYTGARLLDGTGRPPLKDPYLVVEDGRIAEIGSGAPPPELEVALCLPEATIIPGLVDAHLHLALPLNRPDWSEVKDDATRLVLAAAQAAGETLRAGVTTVADCGARFGVSIKLRDAIARGDLPGSRIWACGTWLTITNGHGYFWTGWGLDGAHELVKGVRQMVWEGADFIKIMASGGSTHGAKTNRRRAQYTVAELLAAVEDAHRLNRRVHCHVNATEAMRNCIEAGVDVVEHCNWLGVEPGTIEYDRQVAERGASKGIYAGTNGFGPFVPLTERDGSAQDWGEKTRWDLLRRMQDAGMRIYIDTDAIGGGFDALPRIMERMVAEDKASAMEVLQISTQVPAMAMGLDELIGSLQKGKLADMVFVRGNPLDDMSTVTRPLAVVKDGRIVVRDGVLLS